MRTLPLWLKLTVGMALAFGIALRFCNLNEKVFWLDEVSTAWAVSGYTESEVTDALVSRRLLHPSDIVAYQQGVGARPWPSTIRALATGDAAHPPLYYLLERSWRTFMGTSVSAMRSLSAVISLLVIVFAYLLCAELFGSALCGWLAAALIAVSPFHLYYAQAAREYVGLAALTLASSFLLLRSLGRKQPRWWLLYAVSVAAGLYTSLLFIGVVVVHVLYVSIVVGPSDRKTFRSFTCWLLPALAAFAPWAWAFAAHRHAVAEQLEWFTAPVAAVPYVTAAIGQLAGLFVWTPWALRYSIVVALTVAALVAYALLHVRQEPRHMRVFIALFILVPILPLLGADFFFGGSRSLQGRYVEIAFIAAELSVALLFARRLCQAPGNARSGLWRAGFAALLLSGATSCWDQSRYPAAWDANRNGYVTRFAALLNGLEAPLVLSDAYRRNVGDLSVLSRSLERRVAIALVDDSKTPAPSGYRPMFAFDPSPRLMKHLRRRFALRPAGVDFPVYEVTAAAFLTPSTR